MNIVSNEIADEVRHVSCCDKHSTILHTTTYILSVCLSVCSALTFESCDLESSFLVCRCVFKLSRSRSYVKVIGSRSSGQGHRVKVKVTGATNVSLSPVPTP